MSYTPTHGTRLDPAQAQQLIAQRKQAGANVAPKQKAGFVARAANVITDFVGARGIADQFGASMARTGLRLQGKPDAAQLVENPSFKSVVGSAVQTAPNLFPVGAGRSLLSKVLGGALTGQTIGTGQSLQKGETLDEALMPNADAAVGGALPFVGSGFRAFGSLLGKTGDKIQFSVIKPSQADIKDGFSIENVKKHDLGGPVKQSFRKAEEKLNALSTELREKLSQSTNAVDLTGVYERSVKRLLGNKMESFGANSQIDSAAEKLREEILAVAGENGLVNLPDANLIKRAAGHFGAWQFGKTDPEAKASERVFNVFYNELKREIEKQSPEGVREINKQLSEVIPVMNALIRRIPVAERNNLISLSDVITLTGMGVNPSLGLLTLANIASRSGRVGQGLSKAGDAIENRSQKMTAAMRDLLTKLQAQATD